MKTILILESTILMSEKHPCYGSTDSEAVTYARNDGLYFLGVFKKNAVSASFLLC